MIKLLITIRQYHNDQEPAYGGCIQAPDQNKRDGQIYIAKGNPF